MTTVNAGRGIFGKKLAWAFSASMILFVSSNFVNAGNLLFNLVFSHWMGPELFSDLAFLLTLKLSILSILGAIQFLVTEKTANANKREQIGNIQVYRIINRNVSIVIFLALPLLIYLTHRFDWSAKLGLHDEYSLIVFYLGFPFYLPIAIWRGVAQGRMDIWRMVSSANVEMLVRFLGATLFWWMGLGMWAVILAFVLSLFAAWVFAQPPMPKRYTPKRTIADALPWQHALPWAAIQLGVVLMLDGDVFITKMTMSATDAGHVAAISLVQRIIFFASFSLATILLPQVIQAIKNGKSGIRETYPIWVLILTSIIPVLAASYFFPEILVQILFGIEYLPIQSFLVTASLSATLITVNYFLTVFLMAHQMRFIGYVFLGLALLQIAILRGSFFFQLPTIETIVQLKYYYQLFSVFVVISIAFWVMKSQVTNIKGVQND